MKGIVKEGLKSFGRGFTVGVIVEGVACGTAIAAAKLIKNNKVANLVGTTVYSTVSIIGTVKYDQIEQVLFENKFVEGIKNKIEEKNRLKKESFVDIQ